MSVSWKVNGFMGLIVSLFTYFFSYPNNTWQTSLFRAGLGFLLFYVLGIMLQFVIHQVNLINSTNKDEKQNRSKDTPAKSEANIQGGDIPLEEPSFQAFPLESLHSGGDEKDLEKTVQTIRTWN
ncbi:hypothetical protein [Neobacillus sp.]|uniref:hypothetical protein n=1 Tax=Neobacillus sp. TaxID=2675273 RepID=UPI00289B3B39|nr:hypothetical protein [Neobacillus sp.]